MKKKSLVLLLALAMIFTLALSACGGGGSSEEPAESTESTASSADSASAAYDKILEGLNSEAVDTDEEIVVAMSPDFAPMEFVDLSRSGDDQYAGYDVLLAKYIANHLGKKLVIKPMSFDAEEARYQADVIRCCNDCCSDRKCRSRNLRIQLDC